MSDRICPIDECGTVLGLSPTTQVPRLMCPRHWHRVPRSYQLRIADVHARLLAGKGDPVRLRGDLLTALRTACRRVEYLKTEKR